MSYHTYPVFGVPFFQAHIPPDRYNKTDIISQIIENYKIDPERNNWSTTTKQYSKLHHVVNDWENENFNKIDFSSLLHVYNDVIKKFFKSLHLTSEVEEKDYFWDISNYTCMSIGQNMAPHVHPSDFTAIHYIRYNKDKHPSTNFRNPHVWNNYLSQCHGKLVKKLKYDNLFNTWATGYWSPPVNEDEIIITPGCLEHLVPSFETDELRMTLVINISLK